MKRNQLINCYLFLMIKRKPEEEIVVAARGTNKFEDVKLDYDAEIKLIEEWFEKPFERIDAGLKPAAGMVKALENEKNDKSMNDLDAIEMEAMVDISKDGNEFFMYWSVEEIKHYYGLMWELSNEQETIDDENELIEKGLEIDWHHPSCNKMKYPEFMI